MAVFVDKHVTELSRDVLICRFFCDNKIEKQRSPISLLKTLIFQVVNSARRLVRWVKRIFNENGPQGLEQFESLWSLFIKLVDENPKSEIIIIIDALDECENEEQLALFWRRIHHLVESDTPKSIKFMITSRPSLNLAIMNGPSATKESSVIRLNIEDLKDGIYGAIEKVIAHRLDALIAKGSCSTSNRDLLEKTLQANAGKTFLWVDLVLRYLEKRSLISISDLSKLPSFIPADLASVYEHLLLSIPDDDRVLASRTLRTIIVAARPLNVEELGLLLTIDGYVRSESQLRQHLIISDYRNVEALLGPLIKTSNSKIELVHQSLKDYLIDLDARREHPLSGNYGVNVSRDTDQVARACLWYLQLQDFDKDIYQLNRSDTFNSFASSPTASSTSSQASLSLFAVKEGEIFGDPLHLNDDICSRVKLKYALLDYASTYWAYNYTKCHDKEGVLAEAVITLCKEGSYSRSNWLLYFWYNKYHEACPIELDLVTLLAFLGLERPLRHHLTSNSMKDTLGLSKAAVQAAKEGHTPCLDLLLRSPDFVAHLSKENCHSPLTAAARYGRTDCLDLLIGRGLFDSNSQDSVGRSPLALAAISGEAYAVQALMADPTVNLNLADRTGATPLFWAVLCGSLDVVDLFLKANGVSTTHVDKHGCNALSWAVVDGTEEVVKTLLISGKFDVQSIDKKGWSALSYAIHRSHFGIVKLLIRSRKAAISETDNEGRTAISLASGQRNVNILRHLLEKDQEAANIGDQNGWMPLHWALDPPGYPENVEVLLGPTSVNINTCDYAGRTVLSWACTYAHVEIVQRLIYAPDIDVGLKDASGRDPFSYAASVGNIEIMIVLLDRGIDINGRDNMRRSALFWAVMEGQVEATTFLWENRLIDRGITDLDGLTAADVARKFGRQDIEAMLAL